MSTSNALSDPVVFSEILFEKMRGINPGIDELELYEFRYGLHNLVPEPGGWECVALDKKEDIESMIGDSAFFTRIQIKPRVDGIIVLDENIVRLTRMLFVGLVTDAFSPEWINAHFYFDIRGFYFLVRTRYFTDEVLAHFGGKPFLTFEPRQANFDHHQSLGYKAFREANAELDQAFIETVEKLIDVCGTPLTLAIAGPTAAGKTEIVARLRDSLERAGRVVTSIEMDNFLTDRDTREAKGIHSLGKEAIHFERFRQSLEEINLGRKITIPRYDFIYATSSHDLDGRLKPGYTPLVIEPGDIVLLEGNFPFLLKEVTHLIGIKVVYLTDDTIRMKRKWKRDIDYRKKYEPTYFRNRYFKTQFLMAEKCYRPQMATADIVVDTTGAALWASPETVARLREA